MSNKFLVECLGLTQQHVNLTDFTRPGCHFGKRHVSTVYIPVYRLFAHTLPQSSQFSFVDAGGFQMPSMHKVRCLKNHMNLRIKIEPVMVGVEATVDVIVMDQIYSNRERIDFYAGIPIIFACDSVKG